MTFERYAIYYLPPAGPLAEFGANWLGWDVTTGTPARTFDLDGLAEITATPRKYGFHATLKPPFRLAEGKSPEMLIDAVHDLASRLAPGRAEGLELTALGHFLALTPAGEGADLRRVASACVAELDAFRAPLTDADIARRRPDSLPEYARDMLYKWGYPWVMDAFRFHMTLSGRLSPDALQIWQSTALSHLPPLPEPFLLDHIAVAGEGAEGFKMIERVPLSG